MKASILSIVLAAALAANAWLLRPRDAVLPNAAPPAAAKPAAVAASAGWSTLLHDDPAALARSLRASALPLHLQRALLAATIDEQFRLREETLRGPRKTLKYWQTEEALSVSIRAALLALRREKSRLRATLLGPDPMDADDRDNPLPPEKRTAVRLLNEDYAPMLKELRALAGNRGTLLSAERAQLTAIENEQRAELASLLTPTELAELDARYSPAAQALGFYRFGMAPSEQEFRQIFAAQAMIEREMRGTDKPVANPLDFYNRDDLRTKLDAAVKVALGDARFADYQRTNDLQFTMFAQLAARAGAPRENVVPAWDLRLPTTLESSRIAEDKSLSDEQKGQALQTLANTTRERYAALIGPEAASYYLQSPAARWFTFIDQGWTVTLQDRGMSMRPVSAAAKAAAERSRPPPPVPPKQ